MVSDASTRPPNGLLVFLGSAALFVGVAVVGIGWLSLNRPVGETVESKRAQQRVETATRLEKEAQEKLQAAGWVDKAKGVVHGPIDEVMRTVVAELKAKKPAPSQIKVEPPLPMPVIDPNATEPPPLALTSAPQGADTVHFTPPVSAAEARAAATPPAPTPAPPAPAPAAPAAPSPVVPAAPVPAAPASSAPIQKAPMPPSPAAPVPSPGTQPPPAPAPVPSPAAPTPTTPPAPVSPVPPAQPAPPIPAPAPAPTPPPSAPATPSAPAPATSPPPAPAPVPPAANPAPPPTAPPPLINPTDKLEPTK